MSWKDIQQKIQNNSNTPRRKIEFVPQRNTPPNSILSSSLNNQMKKNQENIDDKKQILKKKNMEIYSSDTLQQYLQWKSIRR